MNDKERLEETEKIWKDIEGYEGYYQISNLGEINSFKHNANGRILSPKFNGNYNQIRLCKNGECSMFSIHRLVAIHFLENPLKKEQVNHKDGIKTNNVFSNLEWVTHSENGLHAYEVELRISQKGEKHGRAKLTEKDVLSIYYLSHTGGFEQKEIADMFDIHIATVSDIKLRKGWKHITDIAEQAERAEELEDSKKIVKEQMSQYFYTSQKYREALEFYAYENNYRERDFGFIVQPAIQEGDRGNTARKALEESE